MKSQDTINMMIIGGGTVISGIINYLVHPLLVRSLSVQEFGEFAAVLSMVNIIGFIMSAGTVITLKLIAQHQSKSDFMYYLKSRLWKPLCAIGGIASIVIILLSPRIAHTLNLSSIQGVMIMGGGLIVSVYSIILGAILQSGGWFKSMTGLGIAGSVMRLCAVLVAIYLIPTTSTTTIAAITVSGICGFILTEFVVRRHLGHHKAENLTVYDGTLIQEITHHARSYLQLIGITILVGIITNADVLIAQHVFGGEIAGTYAAVAVIAKFVVFIGLALETVLLPKLFRANSLANRRQVRSIIGLIRGFGLLSLGGAWLLGSPILNLLKPGLGVQLPVLLGAIIINRSVLSLSISSKILVNQGVSVPIIITTIALIGWYSIGSFSATFYSYLRTSIFILASATIFVQGLRVYYSPRH